ncbi:DEKNAAC103918 [Brettanomyces naardenensis]|uniref:Vacuolar protein-sorting-associated protein 36 n=1 Tax=Brettanomyces naardenensis TaxID=13370 RepID=A0A448YPL4_BRENA|nr:DEKNAAC103918 [Brettanomyces naardenensis]
MATTFWKPAQLSTTGRPSFQPGEHDLAIQDGVGLYSGDLKLLDYQSGRVYLTNRRIIFICDQPPKSRSSAAIFLPLTKVSSIELYAGFLKSSAKILLHMRQERESTSTSNSPAKVQEFTWICPICYYSNAMKVAPATINKLRRKQGSPPCCATCGVAATWEIILKSLPQPQPTPSTPVDLLTYDGSRCPRCTFVNHPSMVNCEMCGAPLTSLGSGGSSESVVTTESTTFRSEPGIADPFLIKLSFRNGGEHNFHSKLLQSLQDARWEQIEERDGANRGAVKVEKSASSVSSIDATIDSPSTGIHGLQTSTLQRNYETSLILNDSLQDLENLLEKGKQLVAVGQKYQRVLLGKKTIDSSVESIDANLTLLQNSQNSMRILDSILANQELTKATTNVRKVTSLVNMKRAAMKKSGKAKIALSQLYMEELCRHICEFMVEENILDKNNGLVTLYELFTMYNEARGVDLVSPNDLFSAASLFESLKLNFVLSEIPITQQEGGNTNSDVSATQKLYIVCKKQVDSSSLSGKLLSLVTSIPGLSVLQIQKLEDFQMNYLIIQTLLNRMLNDGSVVVDRTLEGEFFYSNEILRPSDEKSRQNDQDNGTGGSISNNAASTTTKPPLISPLFKSPNDSSSARLQELGDLF